jgi:hypothetical protein
MMMMMMMMMVRLSHSRPGRALWAPGVEAPRIPRLSVHEGGRVSATYRPSLPLGDISVVVC